jgi:hypothetical protein
MVLKRITAYRLDPDDHSAGIGQQFRRECSRHTDPKINDFQAGE